MATDKATKKETQTQEIAGFIWEAPEYEKKEKTKSWFIIPAVIAAGLGILGIFTDNYLFAILLVLAFFTFYIYANKPPRMVKFRIDGKGIEIDGRSHEYDGLRSFWIFYDPPLQKTLSIRSKKTFFPYVHIPLADENPAEIRKFLLKFLPEKKHRESIIDIWMRRIGF